MSWAPPRWPACSPRRPRSRSPACGAARWPPPARSSPPAWPPCSAATRTRCSPRSRRTGCTRPTATAPARSSPPGLVDALEKFAAEPPAKARVVRAARWPARSTRRTWPRPSRPSPPSPPASSPTDPTRILLSNADGAAVNHGRELLQRLVRQVTTPVRWDLCMRTLADLGVTAVIELAPGRHPRRAGQARAEGRRRPRDRHPQHPRRPARGARPDRPARRRAQPRADPAVPGRRGRQRRHLRSRPPASPRATTSAAGQVIGQVVTRQGPVEVAAHDSGVLTEWLAHHDDPVAPGQPLARIGGHL